MVHNRQIIFQKQEVSVILFMDFHVMMYKKYTTHKALSQTEWAILLTTKTRHILCNICQVQSLQSLALMTVAPGYGQFVEKAAWP